MQNEGETPPMRMERPAAPPVAELARNGPAPTVHRNRGHPNLHLAP